MKKKKLFFAFGFASISALLMLLFPAAVTRLSDLDIDILFKLRGSRTVSENMAFIHIDSRDLQELNQWPITRDYYGYLTFILKNVGARVVGFDILFSSENSRYPEYDADFSEFLRTAHNVCLPFAFADLSDTFSDEEQSCFLGTEPIWPIDLFRQHIIGTGFTNLLDETTIRRQVLVAKYENNFYLSFGLELARLYKYGVDSEMHISPHKITLHDSSSQSIILTDACARVRLNHFGNLENMQSMSLIDLLQTFQNDPESLDFQDKLVLVGVTASGAAPMKVSPYLAAYPASLVHFTVAENVLHNCFIRTLPTCCVISIMMIAAIFGALFFSVEWRSILLSIISLFIYFALALLLFKIIELALPLFAPTTIYLLTIILVFFIDYDKTRQSEKSVHMLYQQHIAAKQLHLDEAEANIQLLQKQQARQTFESQLLLEEKQQAVLRLEKELRDLQISTREIIPVVSARYAAIIHAPHSAMVHVLQLVEKVSSDDIPVLISGETGTGKEVIARAIHESSKRPNKSFIAVNCGALPETLLESELFGHEKGAFTGATAQRKGRFELADGGTLFLDEITETTPAFQAKLLRVLQEGTFERLGSEKTIKVNVRIIAASSKNIEEQVQQEQFRQDLYYRLNGFPIELPPLRERQDDIPLLARHFLKKHGYDQIVHFSERALQVLQSYRWPGNVRELENTIRRAAILAQSDGRKMIQEIDLPAPLRETTLEKLQSQYQSLDEQILETLRSLKFSHSSINQTAQALGDKDRGTITEYFRGLCFDSLVRAEFDLDAATSSLAATNEQVVIDKVKGKIADYLRKVQNDIHSPILYKGLPKKYHKTLDQIIDYIHKNGNIVS